MKIVINEKDKNKLFSQKLVEVMSAIEGEAHTCKMLMSAGLSFSNNI